MDATLRVFVRQVLGAVAAALVPVIAVAFLGMPMSLGGFPGEPRMAGHVAGAPAERHLS